MGDIAPAPASGPTTAPAVSAPVEAVEAAAYRVPLPVPDGGTVLGWDALTVVVVRLRTAGVTGLGYTYADASCVPVLQGPLAGALRGADPCDVPAARDRMRAALAGRARPGTAARVLAAVETALWDASARLLDLPLYRLFGAARDRVPVYGSGGFTPFDDHLLLGELDDWLARGITMVKIPIGEGFGRGVDRDLRRVACARRAVGTAAEVFVDAHGGYAADLAVRVGERLAEWGVSWYEEPVACDDLDGLRSVRERVAADVTAGEYGQDARYFDRMLAAGAVDCLQLDVTRCGFGEWRRAAALAQERGTDVSGHGAPNLAAHVAAATPGLRHLEWFRDHEYAETLLFDGALTVRDGAVRPDPSAPGHGLALREADAEPFRVA